MPKIQLASVADPPDAAAAEIEALRALLEKEKLLKYRETEKLHAERRKGAAQLAAVQARCAVVIS